MKNCPACFIWATFILNNVSSASTCWLHRTLLTAFQGCYVTHPTLAPFGRVWVEFAESKVKCNGRYLDSGIPDIPLCVFPPADLTLILWLGWCDDKTLSIGLSAVSTAVSKSDTELRKLELNTALGEGWLYGHEVDPSLRRCFPWHSCDTPVRHGRRPRGLPFLNKCNLGLGCFVFVFTFFIMVFVTVHVS